MRHALNMIQGCITFKFMVMKPLILHGHENIAYKFIN